MAPSFLEACPGTPVPRTTRHCGQRSVPAAGGGAAGFGQLHACLLEHKALSTSSHLMPAVLAGCFGALRRRRRTACRSFHWPWSLSKEADETAKHWWHHHPRASDILIGWIQHSQLTQGNRIDLEVEFSTSSRGRWRSRGLGFKGPFEARVDRTGDAAYLILADSSTVLRGRMEEASLSIQGIVTHENVAGGSFVLQALPDCYHEWWSHIKGELANYHGNNPGILVFSEDGQIEGPADESSSEAECGDEADQMILRRRRTQKHRERQRERVCVGLTWAPALSRAQALHSRAHLIKMVDGAAVTSAR